MFRLSFIKFTRRYFSFLSTALLLFVLVPFADAQCIPPGTGCAATSPITVGSCGSVVIPAMGDGTTIPIGCPGACGSGSITATCQNSIVTVTNINSCQPFGPCGATTCYDCDIAPGFGNCVPNPAGAFADPTCAPTGCIPPPPTGP